MSITENFSKYTRSLNIDLMLKAKIPENILFLKIYYPKILCEVTIEMSVSK